jgi:hypothetical protein
MNDTITNNDSTLIININEEYKIKIEKGKDFNTSIFKEVYEAALKNVEEIVEQSSKNNIYDDFNNIIAFTGERGKGKSSSMISFRDALVGKSDDKHQSFFTTSTLPASTKFATINIVDPSLFRSGENLFEIILAQMFDKFQNEIKKHDCNLNDDSRRNIIKQFQEVFENLQIINSDRRELYKKESIEALSRLATSSNLRKCFKDLITIYLNEFEDKKNFLVIAIDDFDLNISGVYEMLEDIRHFLIQSNVILLIACKIEQLDEVVQIYYKNKNIDIDVEIKSKKYVDKIIPFNRRLVLPDLKVLKNTNIRIINNFKELFKIQNNDFKISMLKLIYERTNLFQALDRLNQNSILPETLRQSQNFINLLYNDNNKEEFKKYLVEESRIDKQIHSIINELEEINDDLFLLILIKKIIMLYTEEFGGHILDRLNNTEKSKTFKRINNTLVSNKVSIGDIVYLLKEYESNLTIDNYKSFKKLNILKAYIALRINGDLFIKNTIQKYSFINEYTDILSKENSRYSRSSFQFNKTDIELLETFDDNLKIFFSMWIQFLGDGFLDYRQSLEKDVIEPNFTGKGGISPINILNNTYNLELFGDIFGFDSQNELSKKFKQWNNDSIIVKQFSNPTFTLEVIDQLKTFRTLEVKETLPDNYFDTVSLLLIFGLIYSFNKIEEEYLIEGLVEDFIQNPLIIEMINHLDSKSYSFKVISILKNKYNLVSEKSYDITKLSNLINDLFEKSKFEDNTNTKEFSLLTNEEKSILTEILSEIEKRKVTSRAIGNRTKKLRTSSNKRLLELVKTIDEIKYGLNSDIHYEMTKREIIGIINNFIDG